MSGEASSLGSGLFFISHWVLARRVFGVPDLPFYSNCRLPGIRVRSKPVADCAAWAYFVIGPLADAMPSPHNRPGYPG